MCATIVVSNLNYLVFNVPISNVLKDKKEKEINTTDDRDCILSTIRDSFAVEQR